MKKKILAAMFATACLAGCAFGLAACGGGGDNGGNGGGGEKTLSSLAIFDNSDVDKGLSYDLGKFYYNTDVRLNSQFKLYAKFSDGTKEEINKNDGELTVSCYYADSEHTSLPQHFDLGGYSVTYSYNDYRASVSFDIVPSATASPYQLTLNGSMNFKYLEEPDLSVKKGDDTVSDSEYDIYYVTEADYNQIRTASAADFADLLNEKSEYYYKEGLKPGSYYLYARVGYSRNSTFQRVIVNKADVVPSVTTGFSGYYLYGGAIGKIKLSELQINRPDELVLTASTDSNKEVGGEFKWVDGDEEVDSTNSGETKSVKFVPDEDGDYAECFNERIFYSVPVTINKGHVYVPYLDGRDWDYWDGEDHEIKLGLGHSLNYFKSQVTVTHALSEVEVGDDLVLGSKSEIGEYRYNFELKDKVNYYWSNQDPDDKSDVANKYFVYRIIPRTSFTYIYNSEGNYTIDENLQVKIQIKPGNYSDGCNVSPYVAGTLQVEILETYQLDEHNIYNTTVDADLEIVNENGYDWIVITVNQFTTDWVYGNIIVKITAEGDEHYADIDKPFTSLEIYRYEPENVTCPITSGTLIEKTVGTTVSELYEAYPELETKLGKWELYMYVGVDEEHYMSDKSDSSWHKLEDTNQLTAGEIRCKLKYESDFVDDVYEIDEVALTLKGI